MTRCAATAVSLDTLRARARDLVTVNPTPAKTVRRRRPPWSMLLMGLLLLGLVGHARAECYYDSGTAATISFAPPATISVSPDTAVGTVLWTSAPVAPIDPLVLDCSGTNGSGIANTVGPAPASGALFPTGIPWLSYQVLYPDSTHALQPNPNEPVNGGSGTVVTFNVGYALQLVVTGPVTSGGTLSGQLGIWQMAYYTCTEYNPAGNCPNSRWAKEVLPLATFATSSVTFVLPTCNVAVDPTVVTLPTVLTTAFTGGNSTSGQTPFAVQLTCSGVVNNLAITLTVASQPVGFGNNSGVIANKSGLGFAQNVAVQILQSDGTTPVTFSNTLEVGPSTNGPFSIPFFARYYQTGTPVSGGDVDATATYTITYQ